MKENAANSNLYFANKEDERTWSDSRRCRLNRRWRFARAVVASGKSLKHDPDGPVTQSQTNPDWSSKIGPKYSIFSRRWKRQTNKGDDRQSAEQLGAQTRSRFYEGSTNWTETKKKNWDRVRKISFFHFNSFKHLRLDLPRQCCCLNVFIKVSIFDIS